MKYIRFYFIFFGSLRCFCQAQVDTLTFIGQLSFGTEKKIIDSYREGSPQFDFFDKNFNISCNFKDETMRSEQIWCSVAPKETYYTGPMLGKQVEIRLKVLSTVFSSSVNIRDVKIEAVSKNNNIPKQRIPGFQISIQVSPVNKINKNTYKIEKFIGISSPEELSIPMIIDYVNSRLYGDSTHNKDLLNVILDLDRFYEKRFFDGGLQYDQLIEFYNLLHFIEPFINEDSFLNEEARKLSFKLSQISETMLSKDYDRKLYLDLFTEYNYGRKVYQDYQNFYAKLDGYYKQLQAILFLKTPSQFNELYNSHGLLFATKEAEQKSNLQFALGTGVSYGLYEIYNITTSPGDTVQFQNVSRLNTTISAGLIWNPFSYKKAVRDSSNLISSQGSKNLRKNLSFAFSLDYYLYPTQKQISSTSPFGLGLGIGYSRNNLGILGKLSLNTIRYPRQFFIDSFKGQNKPLGSYGKEIDVNDNSLFFDKTNISVGISLVYVFSKLKIKD